MNSDAPVNSGVQLGLVIPCFDEAASLPITLERLYEELTALIQAGLISETSKIYLVDDGSGDSTWDVVCNAVNLGHPVVGIKLTRNFGHQHALFAGLMKAQGDVLISMDADLQDDISAMRDMLIAHSEGNEVVYGVRADRSRSLVLSSTASAMMLNARWRSPISSRLSDSTRVEKSPPAMLRAASAIRASGRNRNCMGKNKTVATTSSRIAPIMM